MKRENLKYVNKGSTQDERMPPLLPPDRIRIDDRGTVDLISFLNGYSHLLNYYKTDPVTGELMLDGDWSFFTNNTLFNLAEIATTDPGGEQETLNLVLLTLNNPDKTEEKIYALRLLFEVITAVFSRINKWLNYLPEFPETFTDSLVRTVRENLSPLLSSVRAAALFYEKHARLSPYTYFNPHALSFFDPAYWLETGNYTSIEAEKEKLIKSTAELTNGFEIITHTCNFITGTAQNILYNYAHIINSAKSSFALLLKGTGHIKPDLALLIAFLELFRKAQQKQNNLTRKHLNFYYKDILKLSEAQSVPDSTYLVMQLVPGCDQLLLNAGTTFDAGKDPAGNTIIFSTVSKAMINQVQIADLRTLFVAANPVLQPPGLNNSPALVTGIYTAIQPFPVPPSSVGFPVIGEDQLMYSQEEQTMQKAELGFALSAPVLFLGGGSRSVTLKFNFTDSSFNAVFLSLLTQLGKATGSTNNSFLFNDIIRDAFSVSATGAKDWFDLTVSTVTYSAVTGSCSICINLLLDSTEQAITAYNPKVHGEDYTTIYPVIRVLVQSGPPYYIYNFLDGLELSGITITTSVKAFRNISVYNQYGQVDVSKPFQPMGVQPDQGAYLAIGSKELFVKNITEADLQIDWQTLPPDSDFAAYYAAYGLTPAVTNETFKVTPYLLKNYEWIAGELPASFNLFDPGLPPSAGALSTSSVFRVPLTAKAISGIYIDPSLIDAPLKYDLTTACGFIKLELSQPAYGFGSALYSNVLSKTVLENAQNQVEKVTTIGNNEQVEHISTAPLNLPNPPFTPVAKNIQLNYTASEVIDLTPVSESITDYVPFYHIDAFTIHPATRKVIGKKEQKPAELMTQANQLGSPSLLLPQYSNQGCLYIGLTNINEAVSVSILFRLAEKALETTVSVPPVLNWSYLVSDTWKNLVPGADVYDGTSGLMKTGIITFSIPGDISSDNTIMPPGLFWIRVQVYDQLNIFSNLTGIFTQVIEVQYSNEGKNSRTSVILPAASITKPILLIPGLKSVTQPFDSTGGVPAESGNTFYTRVSERLRHKQRAIQPWDFERIALQQFPQIFKVKCLAGSVLRKPAPATTELVVIPYVNAEGIAGNSRLGPVFGFKMLEEIKKYLQQYTSAHTQITVRNPVYERLTIKCKVKFTDNIPNIQQLNDDITRFLSPWIAGNTISYTIGEGLQKSTILAFIQQLSYVEFVTAFSVIKISSFNNKFHFYDSAGNTSSVVKSPAGTVATAHNPDILYALTPYSVFASAEHHLISVIDKIIYLPPEKQQLGDLAIEEDFIIMSEEKTDESSEPDTAATSNLYII